MSAVDENQDETLRRQFEQLQAQQQRRLQLLQRRKELDKAKKETNDTVQHSELHDTKNTSAFGVGDNLDLKSVEPPRRETRRDTTRDVIDARHSSKSTDELNEQIRELKDETGRLYKLLGERDIELRTVRRKLDEDRAVQSTGVAADAPAATKIVELSKRVRELTAELETEKTKSKQLIRKYQELEKQTVNVDTTIDRHTTSDLVPGSVDEMKSLQEKVKQSELKVAEQRNQLQTLKAELKVMHRVLSQEVGEGVQLQTLLNTSSGWRGRAQQIAALQKKVNELRRQLEQQQKLVADGDMSDILGDDMLTHRLAAGRGTGLDEKQKDKIRLIERQRKETNEKLAADLKNLEQENELLKQKVDASKARITILSTENKTHKQQIQTLLDKGRHDDELIEALFKQQSQLKQSMEESMKQLEHRTTEAQQVKQQSTVKQQQDGNVVEHLKAILLDKETKVKKLELELRQLQMGLATERTQHHNATSSELNSYRRSPDDIRPDIAARIIDEVLSPTPPLHRETSCHGSRPQSRVNVETNSLKSMNNFTSSRCAVRDSNDSVELQLKCQELNSLYQATSVEKDRLAELVQVLDKRIQEATLKVTDSLTELQTQRRKNALLEKQLGKAKIEQTHGTAARKNKNKSNSSGSVRDSMAGDDFSFTNIDELRTKLDIQRDENEALKTALQSTLRAKEDDLKMYMEMIEETKRVFLHGIQQVRKSSSQQS